MFYKNGFTLAEVILVLAIIGVVAAMSIPALLSSTNELEAKTSWKKIYAAITQATNRSMIESGGTLAGLCADADCLRDIYAPYFNQTKKCGSGNLNECWRTAFNILDGEPAYANVFDPFEPASAIVTADGMVIGFKFISTDCNDNGPTGLPDCGIIDVDVNGSKGKHVPGKDLFGVHIQANGVKPFGTAGDNYEGICNTISGTGCGAAYLMNQ